MGVFNRRNIAKVGGNFLLMADSVPTVFCSSSELLSGILYVHKSFPVALNPARLKLKLGWLFVLAKINGG